MEALKRALVRLWHDRCSQPPTTRSSAALSSPKCPDSQAIVLIAPVPEDDQKKAQEGGRTVRAVGG